MLNRGSVILKYREPVVRWINEADPYDDDPGIAMEQLQNECTVYLIADEDADTPGAIDRWVRENFEWLFEAELEGWYTDPALWPQDRTIELFFEWFEVEFHSEVVDTVDGEIYDDEA